MSVINRTKLTYLFFGLAVFFVLGLTQAATFTAPSAAAPSANVSVPLHVGPDQVKDGSLSVGTFAAYQNAVFSQQTLLNGTVFGGQPGNAGSTLKIGLPSYTTNISANGGVSMNGALASASVKSTALCADASGTIVACAVPKVSTLTIVSSDVSGLKGMYVSIDNPLPLYITGQIKATYVKNGNSDLYGCSISTGGTGISFSIPPNGTKSTRWTIPSTTCSAGSVTMVIDNYTPASYLDSTISKSTNTFYLY